MSKFQPQVWRLGEDWGFEVDCFKADGVTPISGIVEARFRMGTDEGDAITWTSGGNPSTLYFAGTRVTVVVPRALRTGVISDVYDYVLQVVDTEGTVSDQMHGPLTVQASRFPEAA
jgi:hypothetical protein